MADQADDDEPQLPMLRREIARLASELGISDVALERWRPLVEASHPEEQAEARLAAAREAYRLGDPNELRELLRPPTGGSWDPVQAVEVLALEASSLLWLEARSADGQALAARVLEAARRLARDMPQSADRAAVGRAYRAALKVAFGAAMQAENWQGLPALAAEQVEATSRLPGRARIEALLYEVMALRFQGAARTRYLAAERCREALQPARRDVLPDLMIEAGHFLAQSLHALGRLEEAEAVSAESVELAERVGDFSKLRARPKSLLWEIRVSLGPWREALANFEAEGAKLDPHFRLAQYQTAASLTSRIQGRAAANRVAELVELSLADSETAGCTRCRREAQIINAVTLARVGRPDEARRLLAAADDDSRPEPYVESARSWARALLQAPATNELEAVIARCRLSGHHLDALWATIDLGRALAAVNAPRASQVLRDAGREAESMGARTQAHVVDQLLRGLGQRTWRRSAASADPTIALTDREREVAELIANGATNVEIAAALFVSQDRRAPRLEPPRQVRRPESNRARPALDVATLLNRRRSLRVSPDERRRPTRDAAAVHRTDSERRGMGVAVVLMAAEPEDLGVAPGFLSVLGRLGVTHVRVLRDDRGIALVLEGWAFDPASAGEVANVLRRPVDRVLRPLVDVALSDEVGGRSSVSTT